MIFPDFIFHAKISNKLIEYNKNNKKKSFKMFYLITFLIKRRMERVRND